MRRQTGENLELVVSQKRLDFPEENLPFARGFLPQNEKAKNDAQNSHNVRNRFDGTVLQDLAFFLLFVLTPQIHPQHFIGIEAKVLFKNNRSYLRVCVLVLLGLMAERDQCLSTD